MHLINSADTVTSSSAPSRAFSRAAASALVMALAMIVAPRDAMAGVAAGTYGTRDQVRQCAAEQDSLDAQVKQRQQAHEAHVAALAKLEAESAEIVRRQAKVDQDDEASVREFNELVAKQNADADKINQEALESRALADAYNAAAASHNQRCAGLLIRPDDLAAVTRERARAASAPASTHSAASGAVQTR